MSKKTKNRQLPTESNDGPVKPGSVLHRALDMIAHEIVKDLRIKPSQRSPTDVSQVVHAAAVHRTRKQGASPDEADLP